MFGMFLNVNFFFVLWYFVIGMFIVMLIDRGVWDDYYGVLFCLIFDI